MKSEWFKDLAVLVGVWCGSQLVLSYPQRTWSWSLAIALLVWILVRIYGADSFFRRSAMCSLGAAISVMPSPPPFVSHLWGLPSKAEAISPVYGWLAACFCSLAAWLSWMELKRHSGSTIVASQPEQSSHNSVRTAKERVRSAVEDAIARFSSEDPEVMVEIGHYRRALSMVILERRELDGVILALWPATARRKPKRRQYGFRLAPFAIALKEVIDAAEVEANGLEEMIAALRRTESILGAGLT